MFRTRKMNMTEKWLDGLKKDIDESYLKYNEPWKQAGFLMSEEAWVACRKPIADCIDKSGTILDISCSNGYLLESIVKWTAEKGHTITPYGIDLSEKLINVAKTRLPKFADNFVAGSAMHWNSPIKYDYVRTELGYALEEVQEQYLQRLFSSYVAPSGKILLTEYRSKKQNPKEPWMNEKIDRWQMYIAGRASGFYEGKELLRVLVLGR